MQVSERLVQEIIPYENNPRNNDEAVEKVAESIKEFGFKRPNVADLHPTMKPVKLIARLVRNSSKPGWNVLDTFGGSGSTLMACEQTNRRCFMIELDPHYCDVIIERWETFTGRKAELLNG